MRFTLYGGVLIMTKFTKGEWLVSDNKINSPVRHIVKMPSSKPTRYNGTMYSCLGGFDSETQAEEAEANAHLISSAPSMYDEIQTDIDKLKLKLKFKTDEDETKPFLELDIARKEKLLELARGES